MSVYKSIRDIAKENGLTDNAIYKRLMGRKIPYRKVKGLISVRKNLISDLLRLERDLYMYSDLKLDVIKLYFGNMSTEEISGYFGVQKSLVSRYINEWEETGCLVVESKINS